jgi:hypothetical protein
MFGRKKVSTKKKKSWQLDLEDKSNDGKSIDTPSAAYEQLKAELAAKEDAKRIQVRTFLQTP